MTEPDVASSDATNIETSIARDGDDYVINGRKWWITGVADERCQIFIVMGKTDPDAAPHRQQSMVLVPRDTPGLDDRAPPADLRLPGPARSLRADLPRRPGAGANLLAGEGDGFTIAQARLGPGRIHHAMRAIGMAERALALMVDRAEVPRGVRPAAVRPGRRARHDRPVQDRDRPGPALRLQDRLADRPASAPRARAARSPAIKVAAPAMATRVIDRAIEVFGGMGVSDDTSLAYFYAWARVLRIVDGPDAVHRRSIARDELKRVTRYLG